MSAQKLVPLYLVGFTAGQVSLPLQPNFCIAVTWSLPTPNTLSFPPLLAFILLRVLIWSIVLISVLFHVLLLVPYRLKGQEIQLIKEYNFVNTPRCWYRHRRNGEFYLIFLSHLSLLPHHFQQGFNCELILKKMKLYWEIYLEAAGSSTNPFLLSRTPIVSSACCISSWNSRTSIKLQRWGILHKGICPIPPTQAQLGECVTLSIFQSLYMTSSFPVSCYDYYDF